MALVSLNDNLNCSEDIPSVEIVFQGECEAVTSDSQDEYCCPASVMRVINIAIFQIRSVQNIRGIIVSVAVLSEHN